MTVEEQADQLAHGVKSFAASVAELDERLFLSKLGGWTPRDIVAHLIGWNRHVVRGARQILRGELPFYDVDPGPNYSKVNATLVRQYRDTDRSVLLEKLAESAEELTAFVRAIDPAEWDRDFGVRHKGERLTVKSTVNDLIADYDYHRAQLEEHRAGAAQHTHEPGKRARSGERDC
jgi:hypothetical protein